MSVYRLSEHEELKSEFVTIYAKLAEIKYAQSFDIMTLLDDVHIVDNEELYLFHKNELGEIDAVATGYHLGDAGFLGYILANEDDANYKNIVKALINEAEAEFKEKSEAMGNKYVGTFTEVISAYEDEDYVSSYTENQVKNEQQLFFQNGFKPLNVEYCEPTLEVGVLDQLMFLFFKQASQDVKMTVEDLYGYVQMIYSTIYELDSQTVSEYMEWVKDESQLREDFYAEYYQIPTLPKYPLYTLGENPY